MAVTEPGFNQKTMKVVDALFARYPKKVHALLPLLHLVQREKAGWLPTGWDAWAAEKCEVSVNHVRGVITFYNMFKTKPPGKYHLLVCNSLPCGLCGGSELIHQLAEKLKISPGNTTPDGLFSLEEAQCLAACDRAPVIMVNGEIHPHKGIRDLEQWINRIRTQ